MAAAGSKCKISECQIEQPKLEERALLLLYVVSRYPSQSPSLFPSQCDFSAVIACLTLRETLDRGTRL